ncbi:MAG: pyruvate dehydrogenase (acetyl-transferring) E1 component subunit alpha [Polyangiaceae bacterium]|nr:pyruvate dehydrogenase (acetyl-transferring) E1 component subunit alpha [Polyangiaceae bacterium]MCW5791638.1 pyruvate dehydrogenase (acetyl-transferring) E1 component subunit alpha [Polyangiaceae bacterium]
MTAHADNRPATSRGDGPVSASEEPIRVLREDGTLAPEYDPQLSTDEVLRIYRQMVQTRIIDERLVTLQRQGRIGFHIGSLGEEAAIIGSAYAMREEDWLFPCYREFGAALLRGLPLQRYIDNMFGNANDPVKGRQMPDHYTCREAHWGSVSSPIGTQMTQAVGFAWAAKIEKKQLATLVYFGDGSTSSNEFHNAMNFAGVFRTPCVFFCRNNGWAISVPVERQTASQTFAEKGIAYGVPGVRVDGNDLFAVVGVTRRAAERCLAGEGPTLIEALTYRMGGHSTSDDPNRYRAADEVKPWVERDPIERVRRYLELAGAWDGDREEALREAVDQEFREAVKLAESTPAPELSTLFDDVYRDLPWHLAEQRQELLAGPRAPKAH